MDSQETKKPIKGIDGQAARLGSLHANSKTLTHFVYNNSYNNSGEPLPECSQNGMS